MIENGDIKGVPNMFKKGKAKMEELQPKIAKHSMLESQTSSSLANLLEERRNDLKFFQGEIRHVASVMSIRYETELFYAYLHSCI